MKKAGNLHYGYKRHRAVGEDGMIEAVYTTGANAHDSKGLIPLLRALPQAKKEEVWTDKGYKTLASQGIKNRIQEKGYRNRPLTPWQKCCNKLIRKQRYKVMGSFAGLKEWFGAGVCRYN